MYDFLDDFFGFGKPIDLIYNTGKLKQKKDTKQLVERWALLPTMLALK